MPRRREPKREPICGVYAFSDPETGKVMYIGQSVDAVKRISRHRSMYHGGTPLKMRKWMHGLKERGLREETTILVRVPHHEAFELPFIEDKLIKEYSSKGECEFNTRGNINPRLEDWKIFASQIRDLAKLMDRINESAVEINVPKLFNGSTSELYLASKRFEALAREEFRERFPKEDWRSVFPY